MKTIKILSISIFAFVTFNLQAQMKVHSNGYVSIGFLDSPYDGLHVKNGGWITSRLESTNSGAGLQFKNDVGNIWELQCITGQYAGLENKGDFKIYDRSLGGSSGYRFVIDRPTGNVGIGERYPEYKLEVSGDINANGAVRSWGVALTSDSLLKKDFAKINNSLDILKNIEGYTYNFKEKIKVKEGFQLAETREDSLVNDDQQYLKINPPSTRQYGLLSQNVKKVMPEIVSVNKSTGYEAINYNALIPVLIEAVKEQQAILEFQIKKIEELENQINKPEVNTEEPKLKSTSGAEKYSIIDPVQQASLAQNNPNPFNESTEINFYLPDDIGTALLNIYDMQGSQVKSIQVYTRGNSSTIINGSELSPGMYFYTLIADGKEVDTMRMILTD